MSSSHYNGYLFDGQVSLSESVRISISRLGIHITDPQGRQTHWKSERLEILPMGDRTEPIRIALRDGTSSITLFRSSSEDPVLEKWLAVHQASSRGPRTPRIVGLLVLSFIAAVSIFLALPLVSQKLVKRIPRSWDGRIEKYLTSDLRAFSSQCHHSDGERILRNLTDKLSRQSPDLPPIKPITLNVEAVNAFALPGGTIIILKGLLTKLKREDELLGILAHELAHVQKRHSTSALISQVLLKGFGMGFDNQMLIQMGQFGSLRYSRLQEMEADSEAVKIVERAGISGESVIRALMRISESSKFEAKLFSYVSTHPHMGERIEGLRPFPTLPYPESENSEAAVRWKILSHLCGSGTNP